MISENVSEISRLLTEDGRFTPEQTQLLTRFAEQVLKANEYMNLTAITDPAGFYVKHILDSLTLLRLIGTEATSLIDVGSGAGFPGIPLKIMRPELDIVLLDSLQKRVRFLQATIVDLGLSGIKAIQARAEDLGRNAEYRERFDLVTARAVASLPVLLELCLPLAKVGGRFLGMKGPHDELASSERALAVLGGELTLQEVEALPFGQGERVILEITKTRKTPPAYPRKAGTPGKKPLL